MEKEKKVKIKKLVIIGIVILAAIIYGLFFRGASEQVQISQSAESAESAQEAGSENSEEESGESESESSEEIYVDVGGAVKNPQVVCVPQGARIYEAIDAAGGTSEQAQTKYMNLAAECTDGQKIYIPTVEEAEESRANGTDSDLFSTDTSGTTSTDTTTTSASGTVTDSSEKVNINTATSDQLQTLNGIGPSMASRIIEYRETNGAFKSVDDLLNVSGIGEKTLAKFSENVCV